MLVYHFIEKEISRIAFSYIMLFIQPVCQVLQTLQLFKFLFIESIYHIYTKCYIYFALPSILDDHFYNILAYVLPKQAQFYNILNHSDSFNSNYSLKMILLHQFKKPV